MSTTSYCTLESVILFIVMHYSQSVWTVDVVSHQVIQVSLRCNHQVIQASLRCYLISCQSNCHVLYMTYYLLTCFNRSQRWPTFRLPAGRCNVYGSLLYPLNVMLCSALVAVLSVWSHCSKSFSAVIATLLIATYFTDVDNLSNIEHCFLVLLFRWLRLIQI